jgi:hypothetical protein
LSRGCFSPRLFLSSKFGFKLSAMKEWEQGRRTPDQSARVLLMVIDPCPCDPETRSPHGAHKIRTPEYQQDPNDRIGGSGWKVTAAQSCPLLRPGLSGPFGQMNC